MREDKLEELLKPYAAWFVQIGLDALNQDVRDRKPPNNVTLKDAIQTYVTAEIIAELERLLPEVDRYPDGTSPQWVTRIKDRIKELKAKETQL